MVLLKIEIYFAPPGGEQTTAPPPAASSSPSETHYASLSCRDSSIHNKNSADGRLWSLGRKHGDATVPTDKSVSREHVVLSVATANKTLLDCDSGGAARPAECTTPAQLEACKQDLDQMCVFLQNLGKLGSTIVEEESATEPPDDGESAEKKKQANDDDDSDTANSEEVSQSQNPSMSTAEAIANAGLNAITKQLLLPNNNNSKIKIRPVGKDETVVLTKLSNNIYDEQDDSNGPSNNNSNRKRVIVQCGKLGTTIVITRLHIQLALSSDAKNHKALKSLPPTWASGCAIVDHLSPLPQEQEPTTSKTATMQHGSSFPPTAYLVATKHKATPRNLEVWCRGIDIVAPTFVTAAFVERSTPSAPWPAPADHAPLDDGLSFWTDVRPNPKLWSACTLLVHCKSGQGSEVERVVRAAGARAVSLYRSDGTPIDDEDELRAVVRAHENCIVTVADARRSRKKVIQILQGKLGVPVILAKQVAKAITAQSLLQDADGNEIGGDGGGGGDDDDNGGDDDQPEEEASKTATVTATKETPGETNKLPSAAAAAAAAAAAEKVAKSDSSVASDDSSTDGSSKRKASTKETEHEDSSKMVGSTEATATNEDDQDVEMEQEDPKTLQKKSTAKAPAPKNKREAAADSKDEEGVEEEHQSSRRQTKESKKGSEDAEESMEVEQPEAAAVEEPSKKRAENRDVLDESSSPSLENQEPRKGKRKELDSAATNGWLTALPQGKKRRQHIRSKEEIMETKGWETVRDAAPTDRVKGLLVVPQPTAVAAASPTIGNGGGGPNFKAFRKNTVPPPRDSTAVRFKVALPKENPQQQEIEEQQEEIAEQQRVADELFRDAGRKGGRRR